MTHLESTVRFPSPAAALDRARTGPVLINPNDFKFIAGGSPKGGWMEPVAAQSNTTHQSPKGGW
jgi:hypothetical protein